jgi:hypothetical protein
VSQPNGKCEMKTILTVGAMIALTTAANAADGYRRATPFEQVKARCELTADALRDGGGFAFGSPEFVAGQQIGRGLGSLMKHARDYDNCMVLHGFAKAQ